MMNVFKVTNVLLKVTEEMKVRGVYELYRI